MPVNRYNPEENMTIGGHDQLADSLDSTVPVGYALLRKQKRIDLTAEVPLVRPLSLYIEPTNICNFKCIFCPESFADYEEKSGGLSRLSPEDFALITEQIKDVGTAETINFYMMGEPFANKHLVNFIESAKQQGLGKKLILTSNGSLLKPDKYADLCASGLDYLRISIYGPNETTHASNTRSTVKLSRIRDNVLGLKRFRDNQEYQKPYIYVKMIESKLPKENQEFLETFRDVGDEVFLEPAMNWNDPSEGNLSQLTPNELEQTDYFAHKKEACPLPFYTLVIHSDLKVSACCVDWDKKTVVGDLKVQSLKEIWNGECLRQLQIKHLEKRRHELEGCRNCTYLHTAPDNIDSLLPEEYIARTKQTSPLDRR